MKQMINKMMMIQIRKRIRVSYLALGATVVNPLAGGAHEVGQGSAGSALAVA